MRQPHPRAVPVPLRRLPGEIGRSGRARAPGSSGSARKRWAPVAGRGARILGAVRIGSGDGMGGMAGMGGGSDMSGLMWMPTAPPTLARIFAIHPQPVPVLPLAALAMLIGYLAAVAALKRRGDRWPLARTIWWTVGVASLLLMTATGFDGYGMRLFSVHMVQHMTIGMVSPVFLTLGAPVTLALRALPAKPHGVPSARGALLAVLHSRVVGFVTHPIVVVAIFLISLYGLYFTSVFDTLMRTMWGHNLMLAHFLVVGMLYFWGVMGIDPSPKPATRGLRSLGKPMMRVLELVATVPFHAFFGVVIMIAPDLLLPFFAHPPAAWGISPLDDQATAGGIAWGFTELPTLLVLAVLLQQWQRDEKRANARADRKLARAGGLVEPDLDEYNDHLRALAARDGVVGGRAARAGAVTDSAAADH